jgi:hypothetical protein
MITYSLHYSAAVILYEHVDYSQRDKFESIYWPHVPELNVLVEHLNPFMVKLFAIGIEKDLMEWVT